MSTSRRIMHSQIRTTRQPACSAAWLFRWSRSRFVDSFCSHCAAFGPRNCAGECAGHPCQKHPSTKTAKRYLGRTKSGVQRGATCRCTLNLRPKACTARRSASSGFVFRVRLPRRCSPPSVAVHVPATKSPIIRYGQRTAHTSAGSTWEHFLRSQADALLACDFLETE